MHQNQAVWTCNNVVEKSHSDYSLVSITRKPIKKDDSLIDLGQPLLPPLTKVSVLDAFDPLLTNDKTPEDTPDQDHEEVYHSSTLSDSSFYEPWDPFEYMVTKAITEEEDEKVEPIYATPNKKKHTRNPSASGGLPDSL